MHVVGDLGMADDADAAADGASRPDPCAARYPGTSCDGGMRADVDIVRDLNLIIQLYTVFYDRIVQSLNQDSGSVGDGP